MRVAYLCSRYPWISHTFVLREVEALRSLGLEVETFAVRRSTPGDLHSADDRRAAAGTQALLPTSPGRLLRAHARALGAAPAAWGRAIGAALLGAGRAGPRTALLAAAYFGEGVLLWDAMRRAGLRHVHVHFANPAADVAMAAAAFGQACDGPGSWGWSFTMHGPSELYNVDAHRLAEKVRAARFVACISDFARSQLMGQVEVEHWDKLHVVRCGVDPASFRPAQG